MQKEQSVFPAFFIFFFLSLLLFVLSNLGTLSGPQSILQNLLQPLQKIVYVAIASSKNSSSPILDENKKLTEKLADYEKLQKENTALRDQFETSSPRSSTLLPANVVGAPGFLPGIDSIETLIIDKGRSDSVYPGDTVVYQNNVIGTITKITPNLSEVTLVTNENSSFAATTDKNAIGVVRGVGNEEMVLGDVVLAQNLAKGDLVTTKGDIDLQGIGYPPNLIIGKIESVNKQPSSLFQSASVVSQLQFQSLTTVFVIVSK